MNRPATPAWDESTRPTGPAPDPGGPRNWANGQHLVDVHDHLRAELKQLRELTARVISGDLDPGSARGRLNDLSMRQNDWSFGGYCESYCRMVTVHHTLEDRMMLPHLAREDPRLIPVLDRLREEHQVIHGVLEQVDRALVDFINNPGEGAAFKAAVDLLTDRLLSHLSYEERELVEPLSRLGLG